MTGALRQFVAAAPNAMAMFDREMGYLARARDGSRATDIPTVRSAKAIIWTSPSFRNAGEPCTGAVWRARSNPRRSRVRPPSTARRWVRWQVCPWRDEAGEIGGIVVSGEDVTDRIEAETRADDLARRAQAAERSLKEALDAISDGFALYDSDDRLVVLNRAIRTLYDLPHDVSLTGARFEDLLRYAVGQGVYGLPESDKEPWIQSRLERHRTSSGPGEYQHGDGRWLRGEDRRTPDGGWVVIRTDITDLRRREAELAQKNAFLETTLANIGEGIAVFDSERTLVMANTDRVGLLLGLPPGFLRPGVALDDLVRLRTERGDYGATASRRSSQRGTRDSAKGSP